MRYETLEKRSSASGKSQIFTTHSGFTQETHTDSNLDGVEKTLNAMRARPNGLIFCNLVEFDSLYGHRRNPQGYAEALGEVDERLPDLLDAVGEGDMLFFVSDHGNDPTWRGTDHTREYGLLLAYGGRTADLGTRGSFADLGASVAALLGVAWDGAGESFAAQLQRLT